MNKNTSTRFRSKALVAFVFAMLSLSVQAQQAKAAPVTKAPKTAQQEQVTVADVNSTKKSKEEAVWDKTEDYNLSAESDFYMFAALRDYSELTDCEEDAKDQMADEAMATVDLCPTRNIDIRLGHPIEIKKVQVTKRKLTNDECQLEATYTLSTLPPEEMADIDAVCQDEYDGYGASLMLQDGLWQGLQLSVAVGYSGGDVGTMKGDFIKELSGGLTDEMDYDYVGSTMLTTDAAYLYKVPVANLYVLGGAELGWVNQKTNTLSASEIDLAADAVYDGGSPYIFRVGFYGGVGYRLFMKYDFQAHMGYQFQYLYRTFSNGETIQGYANNLVYSTRAAYHFHENFAGYIKFQTNLNAVNSSIGLTYEFWN